ncbi:MAG: hypothetical protein Q7U74_00035 [Saprospiraceae bacterium]|nr:hypothetical protein [Saprospiraceae bacterium]
MLLDLVNRHELTTYSQRQRIEILEWSIKQLDDAKGEFDYDYRHILHDGWYIRMMKIPAGDLVIGKVHKTRHMNYLLSGTASIVSDDIQIQATAQFSFESNINTKKAVFAHSDIIYATTHKTHKTDLNEIMKETVYESDLTWLEGR